MNNRSEEHTSELQSPEPVVREYLRFILSREGQEAIARGTLGYLPLNAAELAAERAKLD